MYASQVGHGHEAWLLHGNYTVVWAKYSARARVPYSFTVYDKIGMGQIAQVYITTTTYGCAAT